AVRTITDRIGNGSSTSCIPAPAPLYRPHGSAPSFGENDDDDAKTPSLFSNIRSRLTTPVKQPPTSSAPSTPPNTFSPKSTRSTNSQSKEKKSFLDAMTIISSYKGKSFLEENDPPMRPLDDVVWRRTVEDSDEDDYSAYCSSADSD